MHASSKTRRALLQIKDCNVVASKLILVLDDLLWVLTDSQLKAMVQYAKSLSEAMEKSAQQRKSLATEEQVRVSNAIHSCAQRLQQLLDVYATSSHLRPFLICIYHIRPSLSPRFTLYE